MRVVQIILLDARNFIISHKEFDSRYVQKIKQYIEEALLNDEVKNIRMRKS